MQGFGIGLSGYNAAQAAIEVIGNNIANSATEGYHRQEIHFSAAANTTACTLSTGDGVEIRTITRAIDNLLEDEILAQTSALAEYSRELSTMTSIESYFGELSADGGLNSAIDDFFTSLNDVSSHTDDTVWLNDLVSSANTMAAKFNSIGDYLSELKSSIILETDSVVSQANTLITQIADLNDQISTLSISGSNPNNLIDQRDQYISDLSELVGVETNTGDYNSVDVAVAGIPVVMDSAAIHITLGTASDGEIGIAAEGSYNYLTEVEGGSIGGLLSLYNEFITEVETELDTLASTIADEINQYHVQGLSLNGSFEELTSGRLTSEDVSSLTSVEDGYVYVRVTNKTTNEVSRVAVEVDADTDTMSTIASKFDAVDGISATFSNSKLSIVADANYEFDFSPSVTSEPTTNGLTGSAPDVTCSGIYTGDENDTYTFTVSGDGDVGNGDISLIVTNSNGDVVDTVNVGADYAAGDSITIANGIEIELSTGTLVNGDSFTLDVYATTDTSGLLSAVGLNSFFTGDSASSLTVNSDILDDPTMFAGCLGDDLTDNANVSKMVGLADESIAALGNLSPGEYYKQLITDIGMDVSTTETLTESSETMLNSLVEQQSDVSGVDINDEAAQLIVYQQMIQASAKYLNAIQESLDVIMEML